MLGTLLGVTKTEQNNSKLIYVPNPWSTFASVSASGGSYYRSNAANAQVTITFNGLRFDWIATMGTTIGKADVYSRRRLKGTINLGAHFDRRTSRVSWSTGFITAGVHTVVIKYNNTNDATKYIDIDRADIWGALQ